MPLRPYTDLPRYNIDDRCWGLSILTRHSTIRGAGAIVTVGLAGQSERPAERS